MGTCRHPHRKKDIHRQCFVKRYRSKYRNEVDRSQRLQINEALHRHRGLHQIQRNVQDELYELTPGKFADIKKVRIFAISNRGNAERRLLRR